MKKLLLPLAVTAVTTQLCAQDDYSFYSQNKRALHFHHFSPVAFYKVHREGQYNYDFSGVGVSYAYEKEKGLNFGIDIISNLEADKNYIETESWMGVRFQTEFLYFMPKILSKNISHQIDQTDHNRTIVNKGTSYFGVAFSPNYDFPLSVNLEGYLFRDMYNSIQIEEGGKFHGLRFLNPFGFRTDLNCVLDVVNGLVVSLKGTYSQAFKKEYWETGVQLALSWRY